MVLGSNDVETIAVVGAGQMGRGIGAVTARAGYETAITDIDETQLEAAAEEIEWSYKKLVEKGDASEREVDTALDRLEFTTDFEAAVGNADFVTEAAVEKQAVKQDIFKRLDDTVPEEAILATNTSGLNITELAETTENPNRVIGTHWFNPPMLMEMPSVRCSHRHIMLPSSRTVAWNSVSTGGTTARSSSIRTLGRTAMRCSRSVILGRARVSARNRTSSARSSRARTASASSSSR